jgi:hypothetical protein
MWKSVERKKEMNGTPDAYDLHFITGAAATSNSCQSQPGGHRGEPEAAVDD